MLFATFNCYLDDSNGAAVATRAMMEALARRGFIVEALTGATLEHDQDVDPVAWLSERGHAFVAVGGDSWSMDARGLRPDVPPHFLLVVRGVPVTIHRTMSTRRHIPGRDEGLDFLQLFEIVLDRFRPEVLVTYGGDELMHEIRTRARARGIIVVFALHNFNYDTGFSFENVDAAIIPSQFAAAHYRKTTGLDCTVLPNLIDLARVRAELREPRFATFVNPSYEKGVYAFARIADELGRRRPDIPLLVVEGRGTERTLADCGLDLRGHGNVYLMGHTPDPRRFWEVAKVCLLPSLWWENQPLVAVEAMVNGVPVVASDRGALPETLGNSGIVLPLPARLTPFTRELPTVEEVAPWVEAIIRLWDDPDHAAEQSRLSRIESRRWDPETLEPLYSGFFAEVRSKPRKAPPTAKSI